MDRYAVIGNPVEHSLSPEIHRHFAAQTGQLIDYQRLAAPLDGFEDTVQAFLDAGGCGVNVTVPFKQRAAAWVAELDADAAAAGAVNTIARHGNHWLGCNTDGRGLVADLLRNHAEPLAGRRILLLGAGGAARGVVRPLLREGPAALTICNRTASRAAGLAVALAAEFPGTSIDAGAFDDVRGRFDLVIHATSAALESTLPEFAVAMVRGAFCYDMNYGSRAAFRHWAARHHARQSVDGLGMLVEQAAEAFQVWRGVRPVTGALIRALRDDPRVYPEEGLDG